MSALDEPSLNYKILYIVVIVLFVLQFICGCSGFRENATSIDQHGTPIPDYIYKH